jgi:hypothetical protein
MASTTLVLFYFKSAARHAFVELKRPQFKDGEISRYVSWFWVKPDASVQRLAFASWADTVRTFEQGVLTIPAEGAATFDPSSGDPMQIILETSDKDLLAAEIVAQCEAVWDL